MHRTRGRAGHILLGVLGAMSLATSAQAQTLPGGPPTGFYVRFDVDGRRVDKPLYGLGGTYDHAIVQPPQEAGSDPMLRSLIIEVATLKNVGPPEGVKLQVHDRLKLRNGPTQSFALTGPTFCTTVSPPPDRFEAEASYFRPAPGNSRPYSFTQYEPRSVMVDGNLDEDRANKESMGFVTRPPDLLGRFNGSLQITKLDTANQVIEGRFSFTAARAIAVRKDQWGAWAPRCDQPGDLKLDTVKVSGGEFRMRYCTDPITPGNSRYCPNGLSPEAPR